MLYTGGPKPYGYIGLGEVMVLVFFGFVATVGSAYVQVKYVPGAAWWGALVVGLLACAILLANNVRDVPTDRVSGKRTLAVRMGDRTARRLFVACYVGSFLSVVAIGITQPWALLGLLALPLAVQPVRLVLTASDPPSLVAALDRHVAPGARGGRPRECGAVPVVTAPDLVEYSLRIGDRAVTLLRGPGGWGECSPLAGYPSDPAVCRRAAEEAAGDRVPARRAGVDPGQRRWSTVRSRSPRSARTPR